MKKLISILLTFTMLMTAFAVPALAADSTVSLKTDKTTYEYGEDIIVTASGGTNTAWVGIYNKGDKPGTGTGEVPSLYWYYSNKDWSLGKSIVIQDQEDGNKGQPLPAGQYEVHLFNDSQYTIIKTVEISITGGPAVDDPDDGEVTDVKLTDISYDLDNDTDGLANGTVTITADSSAAKGADCVMYWADAKGTPLEGYTPLAKFRLTGEETTHEMYDYTIIPEGAETLITYLSNDGSLIGDAVSTKLPEGCNYIIEDDYDVEFQLISDIHITEGNGGKHNTHFTQMLEDVRENSPDSIGIFVNGDIADNGREAQYEKLLSLYNAVKEKGGIPDLHISIGNHDWIDGNPDGQFQKYVNKLNPAVQTENVYYDEVVAGYHFIYLGSEKEGTWATLTDKQLTWFDNRMQEITKDDPEKPVFVLLHQPLYNTVAGSLEGQGWHGVKDEQKLRDILKKYDQIIIAGGHSHWELDSLENMYPGDDNMSIAVNTASVAYLWTSYNVSGGEHADGSNGYFVRVYDDKVLFLGRDIENSRFVSSGMFVVEKNHINTSKEEYTIDLENNLVDMKAKAAGGGELTFESSDPNVVSVIEDGILRAKSIGTATITVSAPATDRYVKNSEQIKVTVVEKLQEEDPKPNDPPEEPPVDQPDEPAHVHQYVEFTIEPTCTVKGYTTYKCTCGDTYKDDVVNASGHKFGEYVVEDPATFADKGIKIASCENEGCDTTHWAYIPKVVTPTVSPNAFAFNNKTKTPSVKVEDAEGNTVPAEVKFAKVVRKVVGKYAVTAELLGQEHSGTETVYFKINPAGKSISRLTAGKKSFTVKWTKPSLTYRKQMTGYQIKYSTSSKMSNSKTVTVKSTTATSKKISGKLKSKKTYYVQLRTYKTINGTKYCSSWSKAKKVKTR